MQRSCLVLGVMFVVVLGGLQGSALAAVPALERAGGATGFSSANKRFDATCPPDKRLLGTGADIGSGTGQVGVVEMVPSTALTAVRVRADEDGDGFAGEWSLGGTGLCATPVPGLERVVATSPSNSANKGVSAACPAGKRLLGTGASIVGGGGEVVLRDLIPNTGLTGVSVFGIEDENGAAVNWSVRAYAICANPVAGLQRVVATSVNDSNTSKLVVANCPAGKRVTGVGGRLEGAGGQVVMDDLIPFPNPATSVQVVGIEDQNGTTANWRATAYAICANSSELVTAVSAINSEPTQSAVASCPAGMTTTGGGGDISGGVGEVAMTALVPFDDLGSFAVFGAEDQTGAARIWFLKAYAICSTPLPGVLRVSGVSSFDSNVSKEAVASCPAGKRVIAAGGSTDTQSGAGIGEILMDRIVPNAALTSVTVRAQEDQDQTTENWDVAAWALCADPPPGLQLVSATSDSDSEELKVVTASCGPGKSLLSGAGAIGFGAGQVLIDDVRPNALLTSVTVTGMEDGTGSPGDWSASAYAICANM